jgi:hypothetical protein
LCACARAGYACAAWGAGGSRCLPSKWIQWRFCARFAEIYPHRCSLPPHRAPGSCARRASRTDRESDLCSIQDRESVPEARFGRRLRARCRAWRWRIRPLRRPRRCTAKRSRREAIRRSCTSRRRGTAPPRSAPRPTRRRGFWCASTRRKSRCSFALSASSPPPPPPYCCPYPCPYCALTPSLPSRLQARSSSWRSRPPTACSPECRCVHCALVRTTRGNTFIENCHAQKGPRAGKLGKMSRTG